MRPRHLLFCTAIVMMMNTSIRAQYLPLYGKKPVPNHTGATSKESESNIDGVYRISAVSEPVYRFFSAGGDDSKPCVIICPGGGYGILAIEKEGTLVAQELNKMGIHALVLKYRIPAATHQIDKKIAPLQDAQQSIALVRRNAKEWGVDPNKVGIMGFSAGGHLASSLAVHYNDPKIKISKKISLRPDFQVLIYPVISFTPIGHAGSKRNLLSPDTTAENIRYFSNENHVNAQSPPAFLVHAKDDKAVPVQNAILYHEKLKAAGVPVELYLYEKGGHGFGMYNTTSDVNWTDLLATWFRSRGIL